MNSLRHVMIYSSIIVWNIVSTKNTARATAPNHFNVLMNDASDKVLFANNWALFSTVSSIKFGNNSNIFAKIISTRKK